MPLRNISLEMMAHALHCSPDALAIADPDDRVLYVNPAFERIYGYTSAEVVGKPSAIFRAPGHDTEQAANILPQTLAHNGWQGEVLNRRKDGSKFFIQLTTSPVYDADGKLIALIGIARDITERKAQEQTLATQQAQIQQQKATIEQRNHELTTSLNLARRLQEVALPERDLLLKHFPEVVIYNRPYGILAGTFYWFSKQFDRLFLAVGECPADGAAGAYLTLLVSTLLNQLVNEEYNLDPDDVLEQLQTRLLKTFGNGPGTADLLKGVRIGLASFASDLSSVAFAGAGLSLLVSRGGVMETLEGTPTPLAFGGEVSLTEPPPVWEYNLKPQDRVFMLTPGLEHLRSATGHEPGRFEVLRWIGQHSQGTLNDLYNALVRYQMDWCGRVTPQPDTMLVGIRI